MKHPSRSRRWIILVPLGAVAFLAAVTGLVYLLWNHVLVDVTGVKLITYWQALGLLVLSKLLFSGLPGGGRGGPPWRHRFGGHCDEERFKHLSPEEREKMREEMRRRFGDWPRPRWCSPEPETPREQPPSS